jgi:hypothetical protein
MEKNRDILTPTQQAKWVLMMGRDMQGGMWGGKRGEHEKGDGPDDGKPAPENTNAPTPAAAQ